MVIAGSWSARGARRRRIPLLDAWPNGTLALRRVARVARAAGGTGGEEITPLSPAEATGDDPARTLPAFEAFFRAHQRDIFGYLWRLTGDEQAAYDLSQETFVRAWQHYDRIASYERPGAWLFRVATNLALTHLKRAAAPVGAALPFAAGLDPSVSDPSWRLAESDAVRETLLGLPPQQRAALALREVYGFSCAEVAEALGVSLAAAKMTLSRGRDAFRARYTRQEKQP